MQPQTLRRVGHKGADLIVPGNTLGSFDAALAAGVDMIEFDVLPERPDDPAARQAVLDGRPAQDARLVLAHDWIDAGRRDPDTLEQGLDHLATAPFAPVELDIDLKLPGYELRVVRAVQQRDLVERSLISSQYPESLDVIRAVESRLRLGWSVPRITRDPFRSPLLAPAGHAAAAVARAVLPGRASAMIRAGRCDALMSHWRLVTPRLVRSVLDAGGELYVWTVDELPRIRALDALGVTGVITNDPRLFAALA
jgi:glycerophosphoryl diester phosphodiesterase